RCRPHTAVSRAGVPGRSLDDQDRHPRLERSAGHLLYAFPLVLPRAGRDRRDRARGRTARGRVQARDLLAGADVGARVIRSTVEGSVTRITISRAERKNAFDAELIRAVTAAAREVERTTRVVVLQSEGDTFCAGADLEWMRGMAGFTLEENRADSRALAEMYRSLYELEMPLVARVQGAAIGGG